MQNTDLKVKDLPRNSEHFSALQEEINKERKDFIKTLSKQEKDNFKFIENFTAEIEKRNLPFVLYANPFGYDFDHKKEKRGYWRFQKFHGNHEPYSKEAQEHTAMSMNNFFDVVLRFFSISRKDLSIQINKKQKEGGFVPIASYIDGKNYSIDPKQEE